MNIVKVVFVLGVIFVRLGHSIPLYFDEFDFLEPDDHQRLYKRQIVEAYEPEEEEEPFIISVDDDLENAETSYGTRNNGKYFLVNKGKNTLSLNNDIDINEGMAPEKDEERFIINIPDVDIPSEKPEDVEMDNDLEEEQTRYVTSGPFLIQVEDAVNADLIQPEFDRGRVRGGRNAQQIRDQAARDIAELNNDLVRQREAQRRQDAADRAREQEELRRQEVAIRLQLEQQRRADELQAQQDLRYSYPNVRGSQQESRGQGIGGARKPAAYEEYDGYSYDGYYN